MDKIETLRHTIDMIDYEIIMLLKDRLNIVNSIKMCKKEHNLPILDKDREQQILDKIMEFCEEDYIFLKPIFECIMKQSRKYQSDKIGCVG
jgi:monofunctional chorismate mutase